MSETTIEYIGYLAMLLIGVSFLMKDIKKLRLMNLVGAAIFIYWGYLISEPPVWILNSFIVLVNIYYLTKKADPKK